MKVPTKFVEPLTDQEKEKLEQLCKQSDSYRIRCRAHAILLSNQEFSVDQIKQVFGVTWKTAAGWLNRWKESKFQGLEDAPKSGAPPTLNQEERKVLLGLIQKHPHQPKRVLAELQKQTGKTLSRSSLRRIAREEGLRWKRVRRSPAGKPDEEEYELVCEALADMEQRHAAGEIEMRYYDEAGFSLEPPVVYAWQPIGERIEVPSQKSRRLNTLGYLSPDNDFWYREVVGKVDSQRVIEVMDAFSETIEKETWVVWDNAPWHTSAAIEEHLAKWEAKGLYIYPLAPYSPELNRMELLWKQVKYHWLPLTVYDTFQTLQDGVRAVLDNVGKTFCLNPSQPAASFNM